ncbi:MAG: PorV/PorQ family protein [Elusimicrobia bacterium]|nr:PorV/PorQ family protein [Elusimicrobiota bacterium]
MKTFRAVLWVLGASLWFGFPSAAEAASGAPFLKIGVGARASGMGSAHTAAAEDVSAIHWNPAGLSEVDGLQVSAMHADWLAGMRYDSIGLALPSGLGAIGVGVVYLSQEDLERRDTAGSRQGGFGASDAAATLSFARALSPRTGVGMSAKYIRQSIDDEMAEGVAFDAGLQVRPSRALAFGAAVRNVGPRLRFLSEGQRLPLNVSGGASVSPFQGMTFSMDFQRDVYEDKTSVNAGMEFWALGTLALRAGYQAPLNGPASLNRPGAGFNGLGMGLGVKLSRYLIDYALVPYDDLGATHRFSLTARF